ncbi:MAG: TetR/AcrR family transcriptional regulator, partial [Rothia mucilaginosa]
WLQLVDYFAMHVVQLNPRDQRTVRSRGLGLEEAIDLCLGAVDTLTGGY